MAGFKPGKMLPSIEGSKTANELMRKGLLKAVITDDRKGKRLANFNTGKKLSPILAPALLTGAVLAGGGLGTSPRDPKNASDVTPLNALSLVVRGDIPPAEAAENPYLIADGTAGMAPEMGNAPTLGTNGAMVFGMHNRRNGGYV